MRKWKAAAKGGATRFMKKEPEEWKAIPGYIRYLISNYGRVATIHGKMRCLDWAGRTRKRYRSVKLYQAGGCKHLLIHKLVYRVFHREVPFGMQVDHIDDDHLNNFWKNLQLLSHEDNQAKRKKYKPMSKEREELMEKLGI